MARIPASWQLKLWLPSPRDCFLRTNVSGMTTLSDIYVIMNADDGAKYEIILKSTGESIGPPSFTVSQLRLFESFISGNLDVRVSRRTTPGTTNATFPSRLIIFVMDARCTADSPIRSTGENKEAAPGLDIVTGC